MTTSSAETPETDPIEGDLPSIDLARFRAMFDAEFAWVCRTLRRLGVAPGDLEDVAQELFVTVHRNFTDYDPARPLKPWLFSFALRFASNYRRLARTRGHGGEDALARLSAVPDANADARDLVLRALSALEFGPRSLVVMHDLEGFDAPEIASQLGIPLNTVYSRLRTARAAFRSAITELQSSGGAK